MIVNHSLAKPCGDGPARERKLEPVILVLAALQFVLAFVAEFAGRGGHPAAALYLTIAPAALTFFGTLFSCCCYTRRCRQENPLSYYIIGLATAALVPGTIYLLAYCVITLLPGR